VRRRQFIAILGALTAPPLIARVARAQQGRGLPVVGLVFAATPVSRMMGSSPTEPLARTFIHALRDLGWVDGQTVVIERRSAEGEPANAAAILSELVVRRADVIVVAGAPWLLQAAQKATLDIPIVALFPDDPAAAGRVASLGSPGGNLTGLTGETGVELIGKRLQLLKELAPRISRVAYLGTRQSWEASRGEGEAVGLIPVLAEIDRADQFADAFARALRDTVDALIVLSSPVIYTGLSRIVSFAAENRLPAIYPFREAILAGGLMSYGASVAELFGRTAGYVDRILKGAKPGDLPVEQATKFELVINLKAAKALGLVVPQTLLARADEIIE